MTLFALLLLTACQKETPKPKEQPYQVNLNPTSPHILRHTQDDGTVVDYYGSKNEIGRTEQIQLVSVQAPEEEQATLMHIDANNRLSRINASNGEIYRFDWTSETTFRLTATTADKSQQVSIPIDLESPGFSPSGGTVEVRGGETIPHTGVRRAPMQIELQPIKSTASNSSISTRGDNRTINLILTRCGQTLPIEEYANYPISLDFIPHYDLQGILPPIHGTNQYVIPEYGPTVVAELGDICGSVADGLGTVCTVLGPIAGSDALTTAICGALQIYTPPGSFLLCQRTFTAIDRVCLFAGSPDVGIPSILGEFCNLVGELEDDLTPDLVRLGFENHPGGDYAELPYNGPFGNVTLEVPDDQPAIEHLAINPVDPAPNQDYLATANIHCVSGRFITISVVGTDGYVDSNSFIAQGSTSIYLSVPGAEGGVEDLITVEVEEGPTLVTSIVF